jgi:hypothetical protein
MPFKVDSSLSCSAILSINGYSLHAYFGASVCTIMTIVAYALRVACCVLRVVLCVCVCVSLCVFACVCVLHVLHVLRALRALRAQYLVSSQTSPHPLV